ncbi:unnamed protein product [Thlaspi arvense]|uniref:Uncharacterized protein n=1 Tax=Thlaspi arvense TaxID=13288 RepID=A0AAU9RKS2_THLAR|nr:unnamed protein product [Thlaspi arvense]
MPNMETETNPIDRTVAHLLFHRPMESPGIHSEAPESPSSTRLLQEGKHSRFAELTKRSLP